MFLRIQILVIIPLILYKIKTTTCDDVQSSNSPWKIFNGTNASNDPNIKHIVSIRTKQFKRSYGEDHICGGTIIKPDLIVTAAHCAASENKDTRNNSLSRLQIFDPQYLYIVAGTPYLYTKSNATQIRRVRYIYVHKKFTIDPPIHDIAVMKLNKPLVENGKTVQHLDIIKTPLRAGEVCTVYGWGVVDCFEKYSGGILASIIQSTKMTTLSKARCAEIGAFNRQKGVICAVDVTQSSQTCIGDSGGPLICRGLLAGLDSIGNVITGDGEMFTSLVNYIPWIEHYNMKERSLTFTMRSRAESVLPVYFLNVAVAAIITNSIVL